MRVASLRDAFVAKLEALNLATLIGSREARHPGNALLHFSGRDAGDLLLRLQPKIAATSQSACASGSVEPSRIVQSMGYSRKLASECVRFSIGRFSDASQIEEAVGCLAKAIDEAKR